MFAPPRLKLDLAVPLRCFQVLVFWHFPLGLRPLGGSCSAFFIASRLFRFEIVLSKTISRKAKTWNCVLNEGKTLDDVRKVEQMVSEVGDADSNPVAEWVTPFTGDIENGRFVLMAGWPNFPAMGKAFGNFLTDGAGDEVMVEWAATATYDARNLYIVEELHNSLGQ